MTDVFDTAGIQARLQAFRDEREWQEFHDPRSLTLALTAEVGELAQALAWTAAAGAPPTHEVAGELADIATYVLHLANALEVDLGAEVERKLDETRRRFAHLPAGTPSRKEAGADA